MWIVGAVFLHLIVIDLESQISVKKCIEYTEYLGVFFVWK